jgi:hypothetical protein
MTDDSLESRPTADEREQLAHEILDEAYKGNSHRFVYADALDIADFFLANRKQKPLQQRGVFEPFSIAEDDSLQSQPQGQQPESDLYEQVLNACNEYCDIPGDPHSCKYCVLTTDNIMRIIATREQVVELKEEQPDSTHTIIKDLLWQNISAEKAEALLAQREQTARINELTRLDNAYDEVTPERFHEYYIERVKSLAARRQDSEGGL